MEKSAEEILNESKAAVRLYFISELDRFKLIFTRIATRLLSKAIRLVFAVAISSIATLFFFSAIAIKWGSYLNNYSLGCVYTGLCIITFVIIMLVAFKGVITRSIMKYILNEVFEEDQDEE